MARKRMLFTFKEVAERGPYDEYPVLPVEVDPQLHLSRNDRDQPFYLSCSKDTVVVQMAGTGRVEFRDSSVNYFELTPGDFVYVPAGTHHRLHPDGENVTYRYRARNPGMESIVWYCEGCDDVLFSVDYDGEHVPVQTAYADACETFNTSTADRTCRSCAHVHPPLDLSAFRWREIAAELAADDSAAVSAT